MSATNDERALPEIERLDSTIRDLRREIELLHQQQAFLQMQVTVLLNGVEIRDLEGVSGSHSLRRRALSILKKNPRLYRIAFNMRRSIQR